MANARYASPKTTTDPGAQPRSAQRGHLFFAARVVWISVAIISTGLLVASVPARYETLRSACAINGECAVGQLSRQELRALEDFGLSLGSYAAYHVTLQAIFSVVFLSTAAIIFWRRSTERMAQFASLVLLVAAPAISMHGLKDLHPLWETAVQVFTLLFWSSFLPFLFVFPDGRFVPRWTRWVAVFVVVLQLPQFFLPGSPLNTENWSTPLHATFTSVLWCVALFAQVYRYRRVSGPVARQQTKWLVFGFGTAFLIGVVFLIIEATFPRFARSSAPYEIVSITASAFVWSILPVAIGVSVLRYRLWDIDPIVNRTLVYAALTVCVVGIYVLVVGYLGAVFRTGDNLAVSLIATGVVAVLFAPLRNRLQRSVNRLMYGERDEPYAAVSRLGERLEGTLAPEAVLPAIVETVREALKLPYAAIRLPRAGNDFEVAATSGEEPPADPLVLPLSYGGEAVGELLLAPRAPGESFSAADRRLLDGLARHAGVAVHGVRVMADLQRSRERLVLAREEERRRLRRDLHDELAPTLAALGLSAAAVGELIPTSPKEAASANEKLRAAIRTTVGDIRRLVYDLRPPALDELGLVEAVRERASRHNAQEEGLRVTVEAPDSEALPPLPAAVEVAAYRIVQEALTNVSRHARASSCTVRLACAGSPCRALTVEVTDDGVGLPDTPEAGVGLSSMRERAAELGGECEILRSSPSGTRILARLPLGEPPLEGPEE